MNDYEKCVKLLTSREKFHIELGLDRVKKISNILKNPQDKIKTIHIAGTNGKGSTCAIISSILQENGLKVGLFTSPHLEKYNERIKINNQPISDFELYEILSEIDTLAKENNTYLTEFEILTVAGFLYFSRKNVDIAVIEVGLGGRLDATNIIKQPLICAITSISKDHTDRLGNSIEEIALEKAGIIKQNSTCCLYENNRGFETINNFAQKQNTKIITTNSPIKTQIINNKNYAIINNNQYEFNLNGLYQEENLSLSLCIINTLNTKGINISQKAIEMGLKKAQHNGRFEHIKEFNLIIDGAHNPDGALALRETLNKLYPNTPISFIYATINTKDYRSILKTILNQNDEIKFLKFNHANAVDCANLISETKDYKSEAISQSKLKNTILNNAQKGKTTVITGSLYAIGEIYQIIKEIKNSLLG